MAISAVKMFIKPGALKPDVQADEPCTEPLLVGPELFTRLVAHVGGQVCCLRCDVGWPSLDEERTTCWFCGLTADAVFPYLMYHQALGLTALTYDLKIISR